MVDACHECGTELADDEWVPGLTVDHEPVLYCAACWERLSRSYDAAGSGHLHKYSGIGKDWSRWGDVLPEDREVWAWMAEEETRPVQAWDREMQEDVEIRKNVWRTQLRLPEPHVLYRAYAFGWSHEEELHRSYLHALQRVTEADEWVYAISGPEECWLYGYRFWPHRGKVHSRWYASPVPNGDNQYFLAQDFTWGILAFYGACFSWSCVFGQAIIDAFDADPPPGWRLHEER